MRKILGLGLLVLLGCGPAHMKTLSLSRSGRDLPNLILGGWDGHRLNLFDDSSLEPGVSTYDDLARALDHLSSDQLVAVYIESSKLSPAEGTKHALFCKAPACVAVLERKDGDSFEQWGEALAIFELKGPTGPLGSVWLQERAVRPPGPRKWPALCRAKTDSPRFVHSDGSAIFPAFSQGTATFALFGPHELPAEYQQTGFPAPSDTLCDEEAVRLQKEPPPERPQIKPDPALMQKLK